MSPTPNYTTEIRKLSKPFIADGRLMKSRERGLRRRNRLQTSSGEREIGESLSGWSKKHGWKQVKNPLQNQILTCHLWVSGSILDYMSS